MRNDINLNTPDVLLVYPPVMLEYNPVDPPYGMMYLAAALREAGVSVDILDLNALRWSDDEVRAFFRQNKFRVVGIGGMTTVYYYAKWLSDFIRDISPETKLIAGGSFVTPVSEHVMRHTPFDVGCIGESELTVVEVVERLLAGKEMDESVLGIVYCSADGRIIKTKSRPRIKNLTDLPLPAYDLVDMKLYLKNSCKRPSLIRLAERKGISLDDISNTLVMFSSRGCPFACTFCYRNWGRVVERSSIDTLFDHIRFVHQTYGANNIAFYDEIFNTSRKWVLEFAHRAKEELPGFYFWIGGARVDLLDEEVVVALKEAGCYEISVGVESFDDRILKEMDKRYGAEKLIDGLKLLQKHEVAPSCIAMLYGFPGDDEESLRISEEAIIEIGIPAYFQFPLPFPGTYLYEQLLDQGRIGNEEKFMLEMADQMTQELFINLSRFPDNVLVKMVRDTEARIAAALKRMEIADEPEPILAPPVSLVVGDRGSFMRARDEFWLLRQRVKLKLRQQFAAML